MAHMQKKQTGFWANVREIIGLLLIVFIIRTIGFGLYQVPTGSMETTMLVGERFFADKFTYLFWKPKHNDIIAFNDPLYPYSENWLMRLFEEYVWGPTNWTKRVIGVPGEHIKGVIENGKPVVYRDGKKLDEPYINKYPLIHECKMDWSEIERLRDMGDEERLRSESCIPKSFDPSKPYNEQPFYNINPARVMRIDGKIHLDYPGTPIAEWNDTIALPDDKNYWTDSDIFNVHLGENQYWLMGDNRKGSKDCRFFGPVDGHLIHGRILWRIWSIDSDESWWILDLIKHPIDFWKKIRWSRFFQGVQ